MTFEFDAIELNIEDILVTHRGWITKLYLEDGKTEEEIVDKLHERRFRVSARHIHQCLCDWSLISPPKPTAATITAEARKGLEFSVNDTPRIHTSTELYLSSSYPPSVLDIYIKRPLPSLPANKLSTTGRAAKLKTSFSKDLPTKITSTSESPSRRVILRLDPNNTHYTNEICLNLNVSSGTLRPSKNYVMHEHKNERVAQSDQSIQSISRIPQGRGRSKSPRQQTDVGDED